MEVSSPQHRQTYRRWVILLHSIPAVVTVIWSLIGAAVFWGEMIGTSWMVLLAWALLEGSFIIAKIVSWFGSRTVLASFHWVLPFISMLPIAHTVTAAVFSHPVSPYLGWTSVVLLVGMFGFVSWASWASLDQLLVDHVQVWEADTRSQVDMYASMVRISIAFFQEMSNLYRCYEQSRDGYHIDRHDPSHGDGRPLSDDAHGLSHRDGRPLSDDAHGLSHGDGRPLSDDAHGLSHGDGRPLSGIPKMIVINASSSSSSSSSSSAVTPDGRLSIPNDARMVRHWYRCARCHHVYDIVTDPTTRGQSAATIRWAKCPRCGAQGKNKSGIPEEVAV